MRISVPTRFQPSHAAVFIALMFIGQELEGTNLIFSVLTAVYIALWVLAYNLSGGIEYPSGSFVMANGLFSVIVGFGAKVVLFEPGDRNLRAPVQTVLIYTVGMLMTVFVVFLTQGLRPKQALISGFNSLKQLKRAAIACLLVGIALSVALSRVSSEGGTVLSALAQVNSFPSVAILFGTTYEIRHSNGKRSVNWIVFTGISIQVLSGLIGFSKEGMLIGFVAWGIAAILAGYSFKPGQITGLILGFAFMTYYLVPYSQYVRNYGAKTGSMIDNVPIALHYLSDLNETRRLYYDALEDFSVADEPHLYDQREGFLDRLIQVAADDALIDYTNKGNVYGLTPTYAAYANIVPHFLWKNKPVFNTGNVYAHEMGELSEDDTTTGISFSAAADAYHQEKWLGILLLLPIDLFLLFLVMDSVVGSAKYSPFALFPVVQLFEAGPAGGLDVCVHMATYGVVGILLVVWTTKVATPYVLRVFRGSNAPDAEATIPISTQRTLDGRGINVVP